MSLKFFSNSELSFIALSSYENLKKKQTSWSFLFLKAIHFCKKSVFVLMGSLRECAEIFRSFSSISVSIFKFHTAYLTLFINS